MQAQAILHAKEVSKIYGEQQRPALDRVSFDAYSGDFIGIMGASGSGKTTLLNVLSTIDKPTGGEIVMGRRQRQSVGRYPSCRLSKRPSGLYFSGILFRENRPDLVLVDVNLSNISDEDGLMLAKRIVQDIPGTAVVILTGYDLPVYRFEAQKIGAKGFINKNIEPDKLLTILQQIHVGHSYFPSSGDGIEYIEELTDSERTILQWLSDGYKRKEIADRLHISERTVSNHLQHIFDKLDVTSSLEAVSKGTKLGYVKPGYK